MFEKNSFCHTSFLTFFSPSFPPNILSSFLLFLFSSFFQTFRFSLFPISLFLFSSFLCFLFLCFLFFCFQFSFFHLFIFTSFHLSFFSPVLLFLFPSFLLSLSISFRLFLFPFFIPSPFPFYMIYGWEWIAFWILWSSWHSLGWCIYALWFPLRAFYRLHNTHWQLKPGTDPGGGAERQR